jgi:RND family efflux transporter MFP subunit
VEARASLSQAQATLDYASITAPFSGRVIERRVDPGALASPGTPLLLVEDDGALRVEAAVEESRAAELEVGDEASVELDSLPAPVAGRVGELVPNVDVASRSFLAKVDLPADLSGLRPGTFARVGFRIGTRPRLVVPKSAITSIGALDRVFVVDAEHAHQRMITWGERQGEWVEVLSGLSSDERVVTRPPAALRDGSLVAVLQ